RIKPMFYTIKVARAVAKKCDVKVGGHLPFHGDVDGLQLRFINVHQTLTPRLAGCEGLWGWSCWVCWRRRGTQACAYGWLESRGRQHVLSSRRIRSRRARQAP